MKKVLNNKYVLIGIALIGGLAIGWLIKPSSDQHSTSTHPHTESSADQESQSKNQTWTCSMHPQIRMVEPGQCPICGMDLIPLGGDEQEGNAVEIKMSPTAMQLASVQTQLVKKEQPVKTLRLNGKIQADERNIYSQTAHIGGRVEQLFINYTGEYVKKGQVIGTIYSPDLVTAQQELFQANKIKDSQPFLFKAAKEKLKNWKLTDKQVDEILNAGKIKEKFPIQADQSGVVSAKKVNLGDYIQPGAVLYEVANLSSLWILFDVYESDLPWVKKGDNIKYTVQSLPGEKFTGKITFIDPVINAKTRVAKARVVVDNKSEKLKPEMFVSGTLESLIEKGTPEIVIPKTAVMWTGEKSVVYVKSSQENETSFAMREVVLGPSLGDSFIITSGLTEGEEIVTNGTFSVDAAAQLAGKPSMMNNSKDSMGSLAEVMIGDQAKKQLQQLSTAYLSLKNNLVKDDLKTVKTDLTSFKKALQEVDMKNFEGAAHSNWIRLESQLNKALDHSAHWQSIEEVRKAFIGISEIMVTLVKTFDFSTQTLFVQHCPMANQDKGADWLSSEKEIKNPYFGASMLKCGEVKETIK